MDLIKHTQTHARTHAHTHTHSYNARCFKEMLPVLMRSFIQWTTVFRKLMGCFWF